MTSNTIKPITLIFFVFLLFLLGCKEGTKTKVCVCPDGTQVNQVNGNCPCESSSIVIQSGEIKANTTWDNTTLHELRGKVVVRSGATLTIKPGAIIKAAEGTGSLASALIVERGAKINAEGTAENPIVMTSVLDNIKLGQRYGTNLDETNRGLWGGLIVLGKAPSSFEADAGEFLIEGIPADEDFGLYGGTTPNDNSGILRFISIRHGGASIGQNNEINGLTLGGVGSGTTIENIEVVANADDGIEFFGGTVNITNALVWAQKDDAYDVDQGYRGTLNNFVYIAGTESDNGMEIDRTEGTWSEDMAFTFTNGFMKGAAGNVANLKSDATGTVGASYVFNFAESDGKMQIADSVTLSRYLNDFLTIENIQFVDTRTIREVVVSGFAIPASVGTDGFYSKIEGDNNRIVSEGSTGLDKSLFSWTFANHKGALNDF